MIIFVYNKGGADNYNGWTTLLYSLGGQVTLVYTMGRGITIGGTDNLICIWGVGGVDG